MVQDLIKVVKKIIIISLFIPLFMFNNLFASDLIITGVIDGPLTGGIPKAVEVYVINDIPDLSIYGIGSANNGGGSDGQEFTFPSDSVVAGQFIYIASESIEFTSFFDFSPTYITSAANIDGDDAIELFKYGVVVDVFGDINVDGTGQSWEHLDGWAYRSNKTGPDGTSFNLSSWLFSGPNALDGETSNSTAATPFPFGTYIYGPYTPVLINEIHADPASDISGDANQDGIRESTNDEFVEIVNRTSSDIDVSGWTISDAFSTRHVFPLGSIIYANCSVVVFGGGSPTGDFGYGLVQTASTGSLGLNNTGDTVTLSNGMDVGDEVTYGTEGGDNQSLTRDPDLSDAWVKHSVAAGSGGAQFSPGTMIDGTNYDCDPIVNPTITKIHDIQGNNASSPMEGAMKRIEGIVVGDFQDTSTELRGFFVQEEVLDFDIDPTTSEGIFVYDNGFGVDVAIGDIVKVTGTVAEYNNQTQLTNLTEVLKVGSGSLPSPTVIPLPVPTSDVWEYLEGMLITFSQDLFVTGNYNLGRYGEVDLAIDRLYTPSNIVAPGAPAQALRDLNNRSRILLDDGSSVQNPLPLPPYLAVDGTLRTGDKVSNLTGVLGYSFSSYRLHPVLPVNFTRENERTLEPDPVEGNLKVASFNVLNYFVTLDTGAAICGPSGGLGCRGADYPAELIRQRDKIVNAIIAIDADILGLIEIENHPTDAALQDLVIGLNAIVGAGIYDYVYTGPIGTDAIKVGFIYKPSIVTPHGLFSVLDSSIDPTFIDTKNRPALAQTFEHQFNGEKLTVAVNHLKSKGSSCDSLGDPDIGDGQGNCNITRTQAAIALTNWLNTDPTGSNDSDFLIIGDLNAYAKEDPITAIKTAGYTDLLETEIGSGVYSYIYYGESGYLDHALATCTLEGQITGVKTWDINADEPKVLDYNIEYNQEQTGLYDPSPFRSSDHDPVVIGINLSSPPFPSLDIDSDVDGEDLKLFLDSFNPVFLEDFSGSFGYVGECIP